MKTEKKLLLSMIGVKEIKDIKYSSLWNGTMDSEYQIKNIAEMLSSLNLSFSDMFSIANEVGEGCGENNEGIVDMILCSYLHLMTQITHNIAFKIIDDDLLDEVCDEISMSAGYDNLSHDTWFTFCVGNTAIPSLEQLSNSNVFSGDKLKPSIEKMYETQSPDEWNKYIVDIAKESAEKLKKEYSVEEN